MANIINGGFLAGKKTYISAGMGIISAIATYLYGELNLVELIQTISPLAAIIFLRKRMV
jgi:hypothetical protein